MIWRKRIVLILKKHFCDIGLSQRVLDHVRWSREDLPIIISDMLALAQHSKDLTMETSEDEDYLMILIRFDGT